MAGPEYGMNIEKEKITKIPSRLAKGCYLNSRQDKIE